MKHPVKLVVDANPIVSALIGGVARKVFWHSEQDVFLTTEWTLSEVKKYIPKLASKAKIEEFLIVANLQSLPLQIYPTQFYEEKLGEAYRQIGERDPKDVDILALALQTGLPIWTNDKDFEITTVQTYSKFEILSAFEQSGL